MPNNLPIYSRVGDVSQNGSSTMNQVVTAGAAGFDGTSANNSLIFTADATNGGFVQRIRFKAIGTNVGSVARIYINNGSANTTAANNTFYGEVTLPATTAVANAATVEIDYPLGFALNPGFRLFYGLGTAVGAGWIATVIGGKY